MGARRLMSGKLAGHDIVVFATAGWKGNRVNCHHVAEGLARTNRVMFVESTGLRSPHPRDARRLLERSSHFVQRLQTGPAGPIVVSPIVPPSHHFRGPLAEITKRLLQQQVRSAIAGHGFRNPILWSFHPFGSWLHDLGIWSALVYHCVDDYAANPGVCAKCVHLGEQSLLDKADVVLSTSQTLFQSRRPFRSSKLHIVPNNAVDVELFKPANGIQESIAELRDFPRPIVGFVGNLAGYKVDLDLVEEVARKNPAVTFAFVGPVAGGDPSSAARIKRIKTLANVRMFGPRAYEVLPAWLQAFDICWIPFNINASTEGEIPMKFFEYLATGRPVIASDLPALRDYPGTHWTARDAEETSVAIRSALNAPRSPAPLAEWIGIGSASTWVDRIEYLKDIVDEAIRDRAGAARL